MPNAHSVADSTPPRKPARSRSTSQRARGAAITVQQARWQQGGVVLRTHAMGKMLVIAPTCVMSMPSFGSATITGAVYVKLLRVR